MKKNEILSFAGKWMELERGLDFDHMVRREHTRELCGHTVSQENQVQPFILGKFMPSIFPFLLYFRGEMERQS
jgi:hypothetical protein